jgi:uncharacterized membrane protein
VTSRQLLKQPRLLIYILLLNKLSLILCNFVNRYAYGFGLLVVVTVLVSSTVTTDNVSLENNFKSVRSCTTKKWVGLT